MKAPRMLFAALVLGWALPLGATDVRLVEGVPTVIRAPVDGAAAGGAGALQNGDFASGIDDWIEFESGGVDTPGAVTPVDGTAQFAEGDSFVVSLQQTFELPESALSLSFRIIAEPGFDTSEVFIPDAFEMSLLDAGNLPIVAPWTEVATSSFNLQEDGTVHAGNGVSFDGDTVAVDLTGAPAGDVTLFFDLIGGDGDTASALLIDDVSLEVDDLEPGSFRRGDVDADGDRDEVDLDRLFTRVTSPERGGEVGVDCLLAVSQEPADANDNEVITLADWLALRATMDGGGPLVAPFDDCGVDPSDDLRGFDSTDPAYELTAGELEIVPPVRAEDRDLHFPILLRSPGPVAGAMVVLEFDAENLIPRPIGEFLVVPDGVETFVQVIDGTIVAALWTESPDGTIAPGGDAFTEVAELRFDIVDFAIVRPFTWLDTFIPEMGEEFISTVVAGDFSDHRPLAAGGEVAFVRGNSNDDAWVDLSDSVFTLRYLFSAGDVPACIDSADSNNDSEVDISDPIYSLTFLFLGGPIIPPPYPGCGLDEGPVDLLECAESSCVD